VNGCVGIELDARMIRGIRLDGGRRRTSRVLEAQWDPEHPAEGVRTLRESLGRARHVAVAVRLPLLLAKRVKLPPLAPVERWKVLRLEPQRFFPVRLEELVVAVGRTDFVFAASETSVASWAHALEALGPVDVVEPGPIALARALDSGGISDGIAVLDDAERGVGVIDIRRGAVDGARRLYGSLTEAASTLATSGLCATQPIYVAPWDDERARAFAMHLPERTVAPLPDVRDVPASFLSAYGAALGVGRDLDGTLLPDALGARVVARRRRERLVAVLVCAASIIFALTSLADSRARAVRDIDSRVQTLKADAAPVLTLQKELTTQRQRANAVARIETERPDPLNVLLALSTHLPAGAHLRSVSLSGANWQIDGYAPQAAEVTQALGSAPAFRDVHVLSATNRARIGDRTYESFSVAFRFVPAP
jgi:Tfp pilus assembly protein PilN